MNVQIIRFLALKGPLLIYEVAQHLKAIWDTKVHYPSVNRRMHDLLDRHYVEKVGTRTTKAGAPAVLYALGSKGEFAALVGIPDGRGKYHSELSPKQTRLLISQASARPGSPFSLLGKLQEGDEACRSLVNGAFLPAIIESVRGGYINIDAPDDAICTNFADTVARQTIAAVSGAKQYNGEAINSRVLVRTLQVALDQLSVIHDKETLPDISPRRPIGSRWINELKVLLRPYCVKYE